MHRLLEQRRMGAITGIGVTLPSRGTTIINEADDHSVRTGTLLDYNPKTREYTVADQKTGEIQEWKKGRHILPVDEFASRTDRKLDVAAAIIAFQTRIIHALDEQLKDTKKLDIQA